MIYYYGRGLGIPGTLDEPTPEEWELFDLEKDPGEMNNVYGDPRYEEIAKNLKDELIRLRYDLGDDADAITIPTRSSQ